MRRKDIIAKRGGKFVVMSEAGKKLGEFDTEQEARERLRQIEAAKAAKDEDDDDEDPDERDPDDTDGENDAGLDSNAWNGRRHIGDSFEVRRVDYLGEIHFDPKRDDGVLAEIGDDGFLRADANLTTIGVFKYSDGDGNTWGELRTPEQVFHPDAMASFELKVVTNDHPAEFVSAKNVKDVSVGMTGNKVVRKGDFLTASIVITDEDTIAAIKDGKTQLSCGYTAQVIVDRGVSDDGTPFHGRQTNIRGNHVAVVDSGRAGPECRLLVGRGDAFTHGEKPTMKTRKVKIGDKEFEVPENVADAIEAARGDSIVIDGKTYNAKQVADAFAALEVKTPAPTPTPTPAPKADADDVAALRARVDMLEAEIKNAPQRMDARLRIVSAAQNILGSDFAHEGKTDTDIMRAVVLEVSPTIKDKLDANAKSAGYLRACFDQALELHDSREAYVLDQNGVVFDAIGNGGGGEDPLQKVLDAQAEFLKNRATPSLEAGAPPPGVSVN